MDNNTNREFKGIWIPREIWLAEELSLFEKCLFAEIDSLSKYQYGCIATNRHFAQFFGKSVESISRSINVLVEKGFLHSNVIRDENTKQVIKRVLTPVYKWCFDNKSEDTPSLKSEDTPSLKSEDTPSLKNEDTPPLKNDEYSNTYNSNTNKSNTNKSSMQSCKQDAPLSKAKKTKTRKEFVPPTLEEVKAYAKEKAPNVDADYFYNYFTDGDWTDSKGNKVISWKQKMLTWNKHTSNQPKEQEVKRKYIYAN